MDFRAEDPDESGRQFQNINELNEQGTLICFPSFVWRVFLSFIASVVFVFSVLVLLGCFLLGSFWSPFFLFCGLSFFFVLFFSSASWVFPWFSFFSFRRSEECPWCSLVLCLVLFVLFVSAFLGAFRAPYFGVTLLGSLVPLSDSSCCSVSLYVFRSTTFGFPFTARHLLSLAV